MTTGYRLVVVSTDGYRLQRPAAVSMDGYRLFVVSIDGYRLQRLVVVSLDGYSLQASCG